MSIFNSGIPINFLGYKSLYRKLYGSSLSTGTTLESDTNTEVTLQKLIENNSTLSSIYDPRGLFTPGMVPSRKVSYRVFTECNQAFVSGGEDVARSAPDVIRNFSLPEAVITISQVKYAVVFFEGHDVIDLPTESLEKDGKNIILPDKVFRVYHAGDKLIGPKDNVGINTSIAYATNTKDNLFRRIVPSEGVARDAKDMVANQGKQFVDTASNVVEVEGSPAYISYTAVYRTIFRDVIVVRAGAFGFGVASANTNFILTQTGAGDTSFQVLRFVLIDKAQLKPKEENAKEEVPQIVWRLSESFGVDPKGEITTTPKELIKTNEQKLQDNLDTESKHYVYNLAEDVGEEISGDFSPVPLKSAYSPLLAKNKQDQNSTSFDENFKSSIIEKDTGFASSGLVTYHSVTTTAQNTSLVPAFSYTSPKFYADLGKSGRVGIEYAIGNFSSKTIISDLVLLALTQEASPGIVICYDNDLKLALVIETFQSDYGSVIVERLVDDELWTSSRGIVPKSTLNTFTIGDFPFKSHAGISFLPSEDKMERGKDGEFVTKSDKIMIPTSMIVQYVGEGVLELKESKDGLVVEEYASNIPFTGSVQVKLPPLDFNYVKPGGLSIVTTFGVEFESVFAESLENTSVNKKTLSGSQISNIKEQTFPIVGSNISAVGSPSNGWSFMAFENQDRVDIALRKGFERNWLLVRDVTLRVPDEESTNTDKPAELPPSTLPFLLSDSTYGFLFLFYSYKNHILLKKIPTEIFDNIQDDYFTILPESESQLISQLHTLYPTIVYDGSGGNSESLAKDFSLGTIRSFSVSQQTDESQPQPGKN